MRWLYCMLTIDFMGTLYCITQNTFCSGAYLLCSCVHLCDNRLRVEVHVHVCVCVYVGVPACVCACMCACVCVWILIFMYFFCKISKKLTQKAQKLTHMACTNHGMHKSNCLHLITNIDWEYSKLTSFSASNSCSLFSSKVFSFIRSCKRCFVT